MTKKRIAALAAILLFAATGAEAQTGEWGIKVSTDEWGDPDPGGEKIVWQKAQTEISIGGESEIVSAILGVPCLKSADDVGIAIFFASKKQPNLEEDRQADFFSLPAKIDGVKERVVGEMSHGVFWFESSAYMRGVNESLEILFAWGEDGQRQSLTWTMDGLREAFAEACGEELDAEEE